MIKLSIRPRLRVTLFSSRVLTSILVVPLIFVITGAIWIAASSVFENIRFARSVDQIIDIISTSRNFAAREQSFASQENDDVLAALDRGGLMTVSPEGTPRTVMNPWRGRVTVQTVSPSVMRIETTTPSRDCRRLVLFFLKDARSMGVQLMEARQDPQSLWRRFYSRQNVRIPRSEDVEAACSQGESSILALVLGVR